MLAMKAIIGTCLHLEQLNLIVRKHCLSSIILIMKVGYR